ncbi:PREDICTED: F-box only protein 25-like isoform X2 [Priapulus caudatus]|uniref:F-box only protein 25-like isoform X2 n=1 Tax=Priapulus caudatus TaxID=37621 RepID=A0ABM1FC44_PRICU|nr:PREDICTED: F-box only protein 25-like isoform X2 [Priapulus caudatus]
MPFIGKDWRGPGDEWVKREEGWERLKLLSSSPSEEGYFQQRYENEIRHRTKNNSTSESDGSDDVAADSINSDNEDNVTQLNCSCSITWNCRQPHVFIGCTGSRETSYTTSLNEALWLLDFGGAVKDIRRFYYVCKVLYYLITEKLSSLSGSAQKTLFKTIQEVLNQVVQTKQNTGTLKLLMVELSIAMKECLGGRHIGCSELWRNHNETVHRWQHKLTMHTILDEIKHRQTDDDDERSLKLQDLPDDCIRSILRRLSNHEDVLNTSKALMLFAGEQAQLLFEGQHLWRELCMFHFTDEQTNDVRAKQKDPDNWQTIYYRLKRRLVTRAFAAAMRHVGRH